jgi:biotin carboxyl carrier protein
MEKGTAWIDGRRVEIVSGAPGVAAAREGDRIFVWCNGVSYAFEVARGGRGAAAGEHRGDLVSPMPGRVRKILVRAGEAVERGQVLLVLEAMKMEHAIRAPRDGIMSRLNVVEGQLVEAGMELAELTAESGELIA